MKGMPCAGSVEATRSDGGAARQNRLANVLMFQPFSDSLRVAHRIVLPSVRTLTSP